MYYLAEHRVRLQDHSAGQEQKEQCGRDGPDRPGNSPYRAVFNKKIPERSGMQKHFHHREHHHR